MGLCLDVVVDVVKKMVEEVTTHPFDSARFQPSFFASYLSLMMRIPLRIDNMIPEEHEPNKMSLMYSQLGGYRDLIVRASFIWKRMLCRCFDGHLSWSVFFESLFEISNGDSRF